MARPIVHEDPMVLLEEHRLEQLEDRLRSEVIEAAANLLYPHNDAVEREIYRGQLRALRREEARVQRLNNTRLVPDSKTYDQSLGDDFVEIDDSDLDRLAFDGISVPGTRPDHGKIADGGMDAWEDWA